MWYNIFVTHTDTGRFVISNADGFNNQSYWAKRLLLVDLRPAVCVTTSAASKRRFVMTKGNGKPCSRCGTSDWYSSGNCKECSSRAAKRWRANNSYSVKDREKERERLRKWRRDNPEKKREDNKRYWKNNKESKKKKHLEWLADNPDYHKEYNKNNRISSKGSIRAILNPDVYQNWRRAVKRWQNNNEERVLEYNRRRRARKKGASGSHTVSDWEAIVKHQKGRCLACGKKKKLTIDHIIPLSEGGSDSPENLQGLCKSCNSAKGTNTIDYRTDEGPPMWRQPELL